MMTNKLITSITIIESKGGPEFPEYCNLKTECVKAHVDELWSKELEWCHCPPACEYAVIAWAGEVRATVGKRIPMNIWFSVNIWWWEVGYSGSFLGGKCITQLAACIALIEAVAKELGDNCDN